VPPILPQTRRRESKSLVKLTGIRLHSRLLAGSHKGFVNQAFDGVEVIGDGSLGTAGRLVNRPDGLPGTIPTESVYPCIDLPFFELAA